MVRKKHFFVEDDILANSNKKFKKQDFKETIVYHRVLIKFYDMLDICLLIALVIFTIKLVNKII